MISVLKCLWVIQEKWYLGEIKRRFNPFNPLTYLVMLLILLVGVIMFGVVGIKREVDADEFMFRWK